MNISKTKFVLEIKKATAFGKLAPFVNKVLAILAAAYEQEEETAPKKVEKLMDFKEVLPRDLLIVSVDTKTQMTEDNVKPNASPQNNSHTILVNDMMISIIKSMHIT